MAKSPNIRTVMGDGMARIRLAGIVKTLRHMIYKLLLRRTLLLLKRSDFYKGIGNPSTFLTFLTLYLSSYIKSAHSKHSATSCAALLGERLSS